MGGKVDIDKERDGRLQAFISVIKPPELGQHQCLDALLQLGKAAWVFKVQSEGNCLTLWYRENMPAGGIGQGCRADSGQSGPVEGLDLVAQDWGGQDTSPGK